MKFHGQTVANTNVEYVVIPRGEHNIVFIAKPVVNLDEFTKIYKEPQPPQISFPDGTGKPPENDYKDSGYLERLTDFFESRYFWMFLTSLKDSPGIEWDTVDMMKPNTYKNCEKELRDAQFLPAEINKINAAVAAVNALDDRQLDEARKSFLASLQAPQTL